MKRFFHLVALLACLLMPLAARAQVTLGEVIGTLPIAPSKVLADPTRDQIYVAVPGDNTVRVIDTVNLVETAVLQLPVGSIPCGHVHLA